MDLGSVITMIVLSGINIGGFVFCAIKIQQSVKREKEEDQK